ncbi:hypothetical protein D5086_017401, partial [Populus alba]
AILRGPNPIPWHTRGCLGDVWAWRSLWHCSGRPRHPLEWCEAFIMLLVLVPLLS